jgi:hypothetical protein
VGKRSPILGYNHNVRYRGLVFHVQTEDSGVSTPHLFTHLFYHGVIVSSRKLVYDAGSAEESIKSLMQAQHKVTLKDLRRGHFDDKIDSYLGGTPGLLPRGIEEPVERASEIELAPSPGTVEDVAVGAPTEQVLPMTFEDLSTPVTFIEKTPPPTRSPIPPPIPRPPTTERPLAPVARGTPSPLDTTLKTAPPAFDSSPELDLSPDIEIQLELDDHDEGMATRRTTRDTEIQLRPTLEDARTPHGTVSEEARRGATISDGVPGAIRPAPPVIPPPPPDSRRLGDRPSTINAATLPPARPISRPASRPALSQPQVVSRPLAPDERSRRESEAVEVYSPAPPSAELPPGERPGQYAKHHKVSTRIPIEGLKGERSGGVPIPAGLGRPQRIVPSPASTSVKPPTPAAGHAPPITGSVPPALPHDASLRGGAHTEPLRGRAPTPTRVAPVGPGSGRTGAAPGGSGGVVMTRPAVIVNAPAKSVGTVPRIRKAREDEGRGFGQGLISEKSLDEVILAYLSEDADEK